MTKFHYLKTAALGALATALIAASLPAEAQERGRGRGEWSQRGGERADRPTTRGDGERDAWRQHREQRVQRPGEPGERFRMPGAAAQADAEAARPQPARNYGAYRSGNYGATTRSERREDARESRQDYRQGHRAGRQVDERTDRNVFGQGYREGRREDWRDDRRDQQRAYTRGYRAGDRSDDRHRGYRHRRWDDRSWRNDNRYDWYRYRAAHRSLFRLGRYYAPHRSYSYSRIGIGFRLGSPFYSNRYWINDPYRYRLPPAYGPYRWVRYYDDALLVDIYSGEVVDVIRNFFW